MLRYRPRTGNRVEIEEDRVNEAAGPISGASWLRHQVTSCVTALLAAVALIAFILLMEYMSAPHTHTPPPPRAPRASPPISSMRGPLLPVVWSAPFLSGGGYCSEAISFVLGLVARGVTVRLVQHGDGANPSFYSVLPRPLLTKLLDLSKSDVPASRAITVCHSEPGAWHLPTPTFSTPACPESDALYTIGRTMFETDRLPEGWVERLNQMDEIWVPSEFHLRVFREGGVKPSKLVKVPEPVDVEFFDPQRVWPMDLPPSSGAKLVTGPGTKGGKPFVFLSVFKWEERKGWDVLLAAFYEEFTARDRVTLYLLTNPYHGTDDYPRQIRALASRFHTNTKDLPNVYVLQSNLPTEDMPRLYKAVHAFVLPSRGEGWGRPQVEAMAMGLPVITTNWSGPTEYLFVNNSYPLPIDGTAPIQEGPFKGHLWAVPSVRELRRLMRYVTQHSEENAERGKEARRLMVTSYSKEIVSDLVTEELRRVSRTLQRAGRLPTPSQVKRRRTG